MIHTFLQLIYTKHFILSFKDAHYDYWEWDLDCYNFMIFEMKQRHALVVEMFWASHLAS